MADQEHALRKRGVPVVALHSRLRAAERRAALERLKKAGRLVVLTTPEPLESAATLGLGDARKRLSNPPGLALTATATPRVREDIAARLRPVDPRVLVASAHRENSG